jgi:hypothetical protein
MANSDLFPLLSKQGQVAVKLARLLLAHQPGDKLSRVRDYADKFGVGVGTVQSAFRYIQQIGAIKLDTRGHLGTFVQDLDFQLLWSITGQEYIVGAMPLPYSRRYEGLATGLHAAFNQGNIPLNLIFNRGANNRLKALLRGNCDFAVMSSLAFKNAVEREQNVEVVMSLGKKTYVGEHVILLRDQFMNNIEDGMRVGIDSQSPDQMLLTQEACRGKNVQFVEVSYMTLAEAMKKGQIDATVWNNDDRLIPSFAFKAIPLPPIDKLTDAQENTEAVIVINKECQYLATILRTIIDKELISKVQRQVMEGDLLPVY